MSETKSSSASAAERPAEKRARVNPRSNFPHSGRRSPSSTTPADMEPVRINPWYLTDEFAKPYREAYTNMDLNETRMISQPSGTGEGIIVASPFHTGKLRNVLPKEFLLGLKDELRGLSWHRRSNDLYSFNQTDDLALNSMKHIKALRDYLAGEEFVGFMERITGIELTRGYLDLAAQRYKKGDHLLCHDDDVHRGKLARKIAYIIYLVDEDWSAEDGGALGLFGNDENRYPTKVVERIVPEFNSIGFFLTGLVSYHTVEEVTVRKEAGERWSVTGWFYGPVTPGVTPDAAHMPALPPSVVPTASTLESACDSGSEDNDRAEWAKWISADYLKASVQEQVQNTFLEQSSVELRDFLRADVYEKITSELNSEYWAKAKLQGPAHVRQYLEADTSSAAAPTVGEVAKFLRSTCFARLLASLTSLDLVGGSQEVRKFEHGHYTLIHDQALEPNGLDAILSLLPKRKDKSGEGDNWNESWGGATHYIADKDELLRIYPEINSLSLVLRDEGTLRFVKYLNHMAEDMRQEISMVYTEEMSSEDSM
ncbi:hypothetical protein GQ54DRAFT_299567 [Martensiomyces pterosporus]|nr:hypothetical protein GQ54DRAFT_299567 [Martensiomyces pterosporus]